MKDAKFLRVVQSGVIPDLHARIRPPIETMPGAAGIVERGLLLQDRLARMQSQFHTPFHAVNTVDVPYPDRRAAIGVSRSSKIDRRSGHPVMRNWKIEFDSVGGPDAPVGNARKLQGRICVKEVCAVALIEASVQMAAEIR